MSLTPYRRVILIVLDGVGIGELPDAGIYGDVGSNTLGHVAERCGGLRLPHLQSFGLGNLLPLAGVPPALQPRAAWGRMREQSVGKDTTTGHWELAGIIQREGFSCYPHGFPDEIVALFEREIGLKPLGNIAASGTDILRQLGDEHCRSGRPIVYTSADSVFQIAAHEEIIPVPRLYEICQRTRQLLDPYRIGRVIARPFLGDGPESYKRTPRRHDFAIPPTGDTILDRLHSHGVPVVGIGKIGDIFAGRGMDLSLPTVDNGDGMEQTIAALASLERGLVFVNLVDFDMLYGHRLDAQGFGRALEAFDRWLEGLCGSLREDDLLIVTADHGCDPTTAGTDHSREYVPVLIWSPGLTQGTALGERDTFADVGATIGAAFGVPLAVGKSMLGVFAIRRGWEDAV